MEQDPSEKVVEAAAAHAEAVESARAIQREDMQKMLTSSLREIVSGDDDKLILINRVPFICLDIKWIKGILWVILSANGAVLLALITLVIQRAL